MIKPVLILIGSLCFRLSQAQPSWSVRNDSIEVAFDQTGNLQKLLRLSDQHNYASGKSIWRLYYDDKRSRDNELVAEGNSPRISRGSETILIEYDALKHNGRTLKFKMILEIRAVAGRVDFSSRIINNEPGTVIREFQYPLVGGCALPPDHQLLNTFWGGQKYPDPVKQIKTFNASFPAYYPPSQKFLQMDLKYGDDKSGGLAANCFAFIGPATGLYFGSHDTSFQATGHGLRVYPGPQKQFNELEAGFYKYPNCLFGQTWTSSGNTIVPYNGSWHRTSSLYREWANTWWKHRPEPQWVKDMPGWQRIIMKHQYGEILFPYKDLGGRVKTVGESVGINTVLVHGWHNGGHDNDYPNYIADPVQGGDPELKKQINAFQANGGAVIWYYSGRLIDKATSYYRNGPGKNLVIRDNTGSEVNDSYLFRGPGTFTGSYDSRTFAVADFRKRAWMTELKKMADQTIEYGAKSVFYDQMGQGERPDWDLTKEFPIPFMKALGVKSRVLGELHDYVDSKDRNVAVGIELLADVTAMQVDYIHSRYGATDVLNPDWITKNEKPVTHNFIDWFRYTFPEIILSDRDIKDDTDIERRVNHTVLKGLRIDIEIYRCRALIDETPNYQAYLGKVNRLKGKYKTLLLQGIYKDIEGIEIDNPDIEARRFDSGREIAIVLTQSHLPQARTLLKIPDGFEYADDDAVGEYAVKKAGRSLDLTLNRHSLAVIHLKKQINVALVRSE
jgi:hypothetical protein